MFCTSCGKDNLNNAKFCTGCGKVLGASNQNGAAQVVPNMVPPSQVPVGQIPNQQVPNQQIPNPAYAPTPLPVSPLPVSPMPAPAKNKTSIGLIIAIVVGCILGIAVIVAAIFVFLNKNNEPDSVLEGQETTFVSAEETGDTEEPGNEGTEEGVSEAAQTEEVAETEDSTNVVDIAQSTMEQYVQSTDSFLGKSELIYATKSTSGYGPGEPIYGNLTDKVAGNKISDFDEDGMPELLQVYINSRGGIALRMYEFDCGELVESASFGMDEDVYMVPAYECGMTDVFVVGDTIYIEESVLAHFFADGTMLVLDEYHYVDGRIVAGESAYYAGSDGEYSDRYMNALRTMGVNNANWDDLVCQFTRTHDYMSDVEGVCEFYAVDHVSDYMEVYDWQNGNNNNPLAIMDVTVREVTFDSIMGRESSPANNGDFIFPDSDSRYLNESELYILDKETSRIAINELYARHGYVFTTEEMQNYFNSFAWYRDMPKDPGFDGNRDFNEYEYANKELLVKYATDRGWR